MFNKVIAMQFIYNKLTVLTNSTLYVLSDEQKKNEPQKFPDYFQLPQGNNKMSDNKSE